MSEPRKVPLDQAATELANLIRKLEGTGDALIIERDGAECAALLSAEEYRRLLHTIELLRGAGEGLADIAAGRTEPWDDLREKLLARVDDSRQAKRA